MNLYNAASVGNIALVKQFIGEGADVNAICEVGPVKVSSLYIAAQNGHLEVVKLLLEAGATVDAELNTDGATALYIASLNGHTEIVEILINFGANVNVDVKQYTPLYVTVYNRNLPISSLLIKAGAKIYLDGDRLSPLSIAASYNDEVKELVWNKYWKDLDYINKFQAVIIRFDEDLFWAQREFPYEDVIIYNKNNDTLSLPHNFKEVKVENIGYLGGSYLKHIIDNYEKLAEITLFIQGYPYEHGITTPLAKHKYGFNSSCKNIFAKCEKRTLGELNQELENLDFTSGKYKDFEPLEYNLMHFVHTYFSSKYTLDTEVYVNLGAQFSVHKSTILRHSKEFYQKIYEVFQKKFPMEDHYLERLWDLLFTKLLEEDDVDQVGLDLELGIFCAQNEDVQFAEICGQDNFDNYIEV
jgi:hypothetical protein